MIFGLKSGLMFSLSTCCCCGSGIILLLLLVPVAGNIWRRLRDYG